MLDLRQIGARSLPEDINGGKVTVIKGPIVLQIQKIRNIAAPTINEESTHAPRMLKLNLTDGVTHCVAVEMENVKCLNLSVIPGTKLCLKGNSIPVQHGFIILKDG